MSVRLVCLDIDGTLTDGVVGPALPGAVQAVATLRSSYPVRFVTNSTSAARATLIERLRTLELLDDPRHLYTPLSTAERILTSRRAARGLLLVEPEARPDYAWFEEDPKGPTVLIGTEGHGLRIGDLQPAVRRLLDGAALFTLQKNRYFRKGGELVTDLGPVAAFLEYASGVRAENFGKPSPLLFDAIAAEVGVDRTDIVMVGDDAEFDASESVALGMKGVLVRTGKYRPGVETRYEPEPSAVLDDISALPGWLSTSTPG